MKAHLLVFDGTQVDRTVFRDVLDGMTAIENWIMFFGNAMCLASQEDAQTLAKRIRTALPNVRFLITTIDAKQKGGWLAKDLWSLMNEPVPFSERTDA